jgi:hypothetical protein
MKYENFNVKTLTQKKLDSWVNSKLNVCMIGPHGVGKTALILDCFQRNFGDRWVYFSGATLDPWTDLIGVPFSEDKGGQKVLGYVRPANINTDMEAVFVDEYNRTPKKVRNALLELQQFKSINGLKFPNLKCVWVAVNPKQSSEDEDDVYDVEDIDPAQLDRFHVIVRLADGPNLKWFEEQYGRLGRIAVDWHKKQGDKKSAVSPRRLQYALDVFKDGGDLSDVLPKVVNVSSLVSSLSISEEDLIFKQLQENPTAELMKKGCQNQQFWQKFGQDVVSNESFWHLSEEWQDEDIAKHIFANKRYLKYVIGMAVCGKTKMKEVLADVGKTLNADLISVVNLLAKKYDTQEKQREVFASTMRNRSDKKCKTITCLNLFERAKQKNPWIFRPLFSDILTDKKKPLPDICNTISNMLSNTIVRRSFMRLFLTKDFDLVVCLTPNETALFHMAVAKILETTRNSGQFASAKVMKDFLTKAGASCSKEMLAKIEQIGQCNMQDIFLKWPAFAKEMGELRADDAIIGKDTEVSADFAKALDTACCLLNVKYDGTS